MIANYVTFYFRYFLQTVLKKRTSPRVLQLPITSRCNSRCVTCNIWRAPDKNDLDAAALKQAFQDPFFRKIEVVGVNGGEPSLYRNREELIDALFTLRKLKRVHFISNALATEPLLQLMRTVKQKCSERGIKVYLTVSIDGVGIVHNGVRGVNDGFSRTLKTVRALKENQQEYCDKLDVGCTLSNRNIEYVQETECFLKFLGIDAYYHPAVPNKRLHNFQETDFSLVVNTRSRQLATEYFYCRYKNSSGLRHKLRSFLIYYYLLHKGRGRLAGCQYLRDNITLSETGDLFLCATASDRIGNLKEISASALLGSGAFEKEEKKIEPYCPTCVHYIVFPSLKGGWYFLKQLFSPYIWVHYKIKSVWLR